MVEIAATAAEASLPRVRLIPHQGRSVVLIDVSNLDIAAARRVLVEERAVIAAQPKGSALTLTDVTATPYDDSLIATVRETVALNAPYVKAGAVVGVTGLKKMVLNTMNLMTSRDLRAFGSREEALAWLVLQAQG